MPKILISEAGKTPQPYKIPLDQKEVRIGRAAGNDILLTDPSTSSNHCLIKRVTAGFQLKDNNSTNGCKVDDEQHKIIDIAKEIHFFLGDVPVHFIFTEEELAELKSEGNFASAQQIKSEEKESKSEESKKKEQKKAVPTPAKTRKIEDFEQVDSSSARKRISASKPKKTRILSENKNQQPESDKPTSSNQSKLKTPPVPEEDLQKKYKKQHSLLQTSAFLFICAAAFLLGLCAMHYVKHRTILPLQIYKGEKIEWQGEEKPSPLKQFLPQNL